jgi:DNA end-binding protein Ku
MPRSIWRGAISFGLVNVPVKLYSAVSKKTVRFNQLHEKDNQRIQMKRWCPGEEEEVPYEEIVKGYEVSPDRYVVITPEELEALDPKKTRTINIEDFVDLEEIDPLYYEHPYYLVPDTGAAKAYKLLLTALAESKKVAIARVVIRSKEYLTAIRPADGILTMETMLFHDELVSPGQLDELPDEDVEATDREVQMAKQLIESLSADFEPDKYHDTYRERVLELIERKAGGEEITLEPVSDEPAKVPDLMAALEASLAAAKKPPAKKGRTAKASSNGAGKQSRADGAGKDGAAPKRSAPRKKREKTKSREWRLWRRRSYASGRVAGDGATL